MVILQQSVGDAGANLAADVTLVQTLLNRIVRLSGSPALPVSGTCDAATVDAIRNFQFRLVNLLKPDGKINPDGRSWKKLITLAALQDPPPVSTTQTPATPGQDPRLSGEAWFVVNQARYPNSKSLDDLEPAFQIRAKAFIAALKQAGATVQVSATRRDRTRAWLMHFCCLIAESAAAAKAVTKNADCDIIWDHKDNAATRQGALEMKQCFDIAFPAALKSRHIDGLAVDMTISWHGSLDIKSGQGQILAIGAPFDGSNPDLHAVGKSYGVIKLLSDLPHWSSDGH